MGEEDLETMMVTYEWGFQIPDNPARSVVSRDCALSIGTCLRALCHLRMDSLVLKGNGGVAQEIACLGNEADCDASADSPFTNAGLQGMWSTYFTALRDMVLRVIVLTGHRFQHGSHSQGWTWSTKRQFNDA